MNKPLARWALLAAAAVLIGALAWSLWPSSTTLARRAAALTEQQSATFVATQYLVVTQNADSAYELTPSSWLAQARELMTSRGYTDLTAQAGANPGIDWTYFHTNGWHVAVAVSCAPDTEAGTTTPTSVIEWCDVTDTTVTSTGQAVATSSLPNLWSYNGPQAPGVLVMVERSGRWLVDDDETNQAAQ